MFKKLLIIGLICLLCKISYAKSVSETEKNLKITFDSLQVEANNVDSQIFIIKNNIRISKSNIIIGFADIAGSYEKYKRNLPITSTFDNTSHYFTISIACSYLDNSIICIRECWNTSNEKCIFNSISFNLDYILTTPKFLLKDTSIN